MAFDVPPLDPADVLFADFALPEHVPFGGDLKHKLIQAMTTFLETKGIAVAERHFSDFVDYVAGLPGVHAKP